MMITFTAEFEVQMVSSGAEVHVQYNHSLSTMTFTITKDKIVIPHFTMVIGLPSFS